MAKTASKIFRCIIMGPPGSGKGTVSSRIVKDFGMLHIACGDYLRTHMRNQTELGKEAKTFVLDGRLVPDSLVAKIMLAELSTKRKTNWLLDGFPRTVGQAKILQEQEPANAVIQLDVPFKTIVDRVKERWIHEPSGRIYNLSFNPPKVPGKDDVTGELLTQRADDNPTTVQKRLDSYREWEMPVAQYYRTLNALATFSGSYTNEIWPKVHAWLAERIPAQKHTDYGNKMI